MVSSLYHMPLPFYVNLNDSLPHTHCPAKVPSLPMAPATGVFDVSDSLFSNFTSSLYCFVLLDPPLSYSF